MRADAADAARALPARFRLTADGRPLAIVSPSGQPTPTPEPGTAERPANAPVIIPVAMPVEIGARR